ncbi:Cathepsin_B [Hexamita inflata]|uniref:Cathepsin B n=1 Tax=Hexamita inflata TaxID=28002 RepID=A0AA86QX09_9EUKA|nr:Cathepsin B [Hexamita inflata]CAI9964792.1 Cathepsin B [Hexamita inflata]
MLTLPFYDVSFQYLLNSIPGLTFEARMNPMFNNASITQIKHFLLPSKYISHQSSNISPDNIRLKQFDSRLAWPNCTPKIRNQELCGSCWAFSAVNSFSDRLCVKSNTYSALSEQFLISCDQYNEGCEGGYLKNANQFLQRTGVPSLNCVQYVSGGGESFICPVKCDDGNEMELQTSKGFKVVFGEGQMKENILKGPIQVQFAVYQDFMYYYKGIYQHMAGNEIGGHAVVAIGWGIDRGTPYWICRNSWGAEWGENGYFRITRGNNECEIETEAFAVQV